MRARNSSSIGSSTLRQGPTARRFSPRRARAGAGLQVGFRFRHQRHCLFAEVAVHLAFLGQPQLARGALEQLDLQEVSSRWMLALAAAGDRPCLRPAAEAAQLRSVEEQADQRLSMDHHRAGGAGHQSRPAGFSSMWMRTGTRCARRTQLKVG
jgi:hypothetical protein